MSSSDSRRLLLSLLRDRVLEVLVASSIRAQVDSQVRVAERAAEQLLLPTQVPERA